MNSFKHVPINLTNLENFIQNGNFLSLNVVSMYKLFTNSKSRSSLL